MNYYRVVVGGDEDDLRISKKFIPFIARVDDKFSNDFSDLLRNGVTINEKEWDKKISLNSIQDGITTTCLITATRWLVFHDKFVDQILHKGISGIQFLPLKVYKKDLTVLEGFTTVGNIITLSDCIDYNHSEIKYYSGNLPFLQGRIIGFKKLFLSEANLPTGDLFRLEKISTYIIASDKFVKSFKEFGGTGLRFDEIDVI